MNKFRFTINALAIAIFTFAFASMAQAQATRTWVSGVGDDANPCSRTAPCKTFAGAISKTAVDGEIDALDPGGFGGVTITKAITIDGNGWGSVLVAGTNAINISIGGTSGSNTVEIRNLSINGAGSGFIGINTSGTSFAGVQIFVENCVIFGFRGNGTNSRGISDSRVVAGALFVHNTLIKNNTGSGVVTIGASATTANIDNCQSEGNGGVGFVSSGNGRQMVVRNSVGNKNAVAGFFAENSAKLDVIDSLTSFNAQGIEADSSSEIRVSRTTITRNTANGLNLAGGTILSYGTNEISANAGNEAFTGGGPTLH
jgi:hypothetical protein